jgi:chorismate mutase
LLQLLNERTRIAVKVGESKKEAGVSLCDHTREREVIERMFRVNEGHLMAQALVDGPQALLSHELPIFLEDVRIVREAYEQRCRLVKTYL